MKFKVGQTVRVKSLKGANTRTAALYLDKYSHRDVEVGDTFKIYDITNHNYEYSYRAFHMGTWCNEEDLEFVSPIIISTLRKINGANATTKNNHWYNKRW